MIWFVDDDRESIADYLRMLKDGGLAVMHIAKASQLDTVLSSIDVPELVVLDVMFPGDEAFSSSLYSRGLTAGVSIFAGIRARFPDVPVIVLTAHGGLSVQSFFERQSRCMFREKGDTLPEDLLRLIRIFIDGKGASFTERLKRCPAGREHAHAFEALGSAMLEYLFVPPLEPPLRQVARGGGFDVRDAIFSNSAPEGFWRLLRDEFSCRHVVVEFKNYNEAIGKNEVIQLKDYLSRKPLGRFGLLVSRSTPSPAALEARRRAYEDDDMLVLFIDDDAFEQMIVLRLDGKDPSRILARAKQNFELSY